MFEWLFGKDKKAAPNPSAPSAPHLAGAGAVVAAVPSQRPMDIALQHHQAGRLSEAEAAYRNALAIDPENIDALHFLGVIAYQLGRHQRAEELISQALSRNTSNAAAHNNLGNVLAAQGRRDEAIASYRRALSLAPEYVDAHFNLAASLSARGELNEAIACYQKAVALKSDFPQAHFQLANALKEQGRLNEAIACYRNALAFMPDSAPIHNNLGSALLDQGRRDEALACFRKALALSPDFPEAHYNLGNVLKDQGELEEAIACYQKTVALRSEFPEAHFNLGNAFRSRKRLDEAAGSYQAALALQPDFPDAHLRLGMTFADQGRMDDAIGCCRKALSLNPGLAEARWMIAMSQIPALYESQSEPERCRAGFSMELGNLERWFDAHRVTDGFKAVGAQQPFCLAYQEDNNRDLLERYGNLCARIMAEWFSVQGIAPSTVRASGGAIRVGVVSQYFCDHSVWNAIVKGWFQQLDRQRFSLHAFCLGDAEDAETAFAKSRATHFERGRRELRQWVEAILRQRLDVLLYPEIGMDPMAVRLASLRLAPVQAVTWGHPETSGLPTIDYYLSAEDLEPADAQANYTEQLVTLPHLGCFYQRSRTVAGAPDLDDLGIDPHVPLLLCPGVPFKYAPRHDPVLIEIARRLGRCRFVFFTHRLAGLSARLRQRLAAAFGCHQLDLDDFVTFVPWQNRGGFYGLLERADVFLDTIGFSGFNTALQAVECGLPIVTREGRFMRGRLASGILKRMGLPELVARSEEDYVALAVKLARDTEYRKHICERIVASRHVLFEDIAPIRALEAFLVEATRRS